MTLTSFQLPDRGPLTPLKALAATATLSCWAALATTAGAQQAFLNEVLLRPGFPGAELPAYENQWVELFNPGEADVDLGGWTLSDREGSAVATLPAISLPPASFLTIHWEDGTDDMDFSDRDGHLYLGDVPWPFDALTDECALYSGPPSPTTIVDFIAWNVGPAYLPGQAHDYAVRRGIWTAETYFDPMPVHIANTLGRRFNGWDTDQPEDWMIYRWYEYITVGPTQPENPIQISPAKNAVLSEVAPTFDWQDAPTVELFQLQVDNDLDFSSPVIDALVSDSEYTDPVGLTTDVYFYRLRGLAAGEESHWSATWLFAVDAAGELPLEPRAPACPFRWQHKDTKLLCIWDGSWDSRPGDGETGDHAWDIPHPDAVPPGNEPHCDNYCVRASIAMLNAKYGGDLSQDRISYHYFREIRDREPGPEGDLGHGLWMEGKDFIDTISWALGGKAINAIRGPAGGFTFAQIQRWVDQLDCFITHIDGHVVVTVGYAQLAAGNRLIEVAYVHDPERGPFTRKVFTWRNIGRPQPGGIAGDITWVFLQPAPPTPIQGRCQEPSVLTDSDGDGVMDFDEEVRGFHSDKDDPDTDDDQVPDKNDIRNYTFHDSYHQGHDNDALTFSDFDGDGLRSENDCDSDSPDARGGDGDFDGGEDIDGDGHNDPSTEETCMFDPADSELEVHVSKQLYAVGERVMLVDQHGVRESHTFHSSSTYHYELGPGCPNKANDSPLTHHGSFTTDTGGHAQPKVVQICPAPGTYYLTVDILDDHNYSEPDNTDPQTCWQCGAPVWDCVFSTVPGTTFSPSRWTRDGETIGTTFTGGVSPPPEIPWYDRRILPDHPNDWHFSVSQSCGTFTGELHVWVVGFAPDDQIKVDLFCPAELALPTLMLDVDVSTDRYRISDGGGIDGGGILWEGTWTGYPANLPPFLQTTGASRANYYTGGGPVVIIPTLTTTGAAITALLLLTAGAALIARRRSAHRPPTPPAGSPPGRRGWRGGRG